MDSYATAAKKGPKQSDEEKRAPAPPEVEHTDSASTSSLVDVDSNSVHTVPSDYKSSSIKTSTQADRLERESASASAKSEDTARKATAEFEKREKEAKAKAQRAKSSLQENSNNPVFVGNAVAVVGLSGALGFGAYRKYVRGELTWGVVGTWAGVVGLFAVGDYYLSQYLFKNKYPKK